MFEPKDIMIEDLRYIRVLLTENESGGQGRVNFLITLTTAVAAGLIALQSNDPKPEWADEVAMSALIGLLAFSILIYLRILRRDKQTDHYIAESIKLWKAIQKEVGETDSVRVHETKWGTNDPWWATYVRGGYSQMVALIMGFITAATANVGSCSILQSGLLGLAVFVLASVGPQYFRGQRRNTLGI